jgi:hypothetical protein
VADKSHGVQICKWESWLQARTIVVDIILRKPLTRRAVVFMIMSCPGIFGFVQDFLKTLSSEPVMKCYAVFPSCNSTLSDDQRYHLRNAPIKNSAKCHIDYSAKSLLWGRIFNIPSVNVSQASDEIN